MATVHPFPARMAPELVEHKLSMFEPGKILLDPMMGSGSFVLGAAARGHHAIGLDSDPLARIIVEAAAGTYDKNDVLTAAHSIVDSAHTLVGQAPASSDSETLAFIDYWFDPRTRDTLAALAHFIGETSAPIQAPLWCAFSRLIITKDQGASRARDVSHSRPHRVRETASFDPLDRFIDSTGTVLNRSSQLPIDRLTVLEGDARELPLEDVSIDGIMTSPPYLIAIDYLRGHRLSLVWMGYTIKELRELRGTNVGSERGSDLEPRLQELFNLAVNGELSSRKRRVLNTYLRDIDALVSEQSRVLRLGGTLTYVVANARHGNSSISVEKIVSGCAVNYGFKLMDRSERQLPQQKRYLPPPSMGIKPMDKRMHTEVILSFRKS